MAGEQHPPENEDDEEARAFILARRAKFVAAALASAGIAAAGCDGPGPFACLEPPRPPGTAPTPSVCLSPPYRPAPSAEAPMACLSAVPAPSTAAPYGSAPSRPAVCLSAPSRGGGAEKKRPHPLTCLTELHRPPQQRDEES